MLRYKGKFPTFALFALALFAGCDRDNDVTTAPQPVSVSLSLAVHNDTVEVGKTVQVGIGSMKVTPSGTSTDITWSSTNASVATVSQNGMVTGVATGNVYVIATSVAMPSVKDSTSFTVMEPVLATISVSPHSASTIAGGQIVLNANIKVINGLSTGILWSSSNSAVATVSQNGVVSTIAGGSVLITASSVAVPSVSDTSRVTVIPIPQVQSISPPFTADTVRVGQTQNLKLFTVVADSGAVTTYHCLSTNALVATIDPVTCVLKAWTTSPSGGALPIQIIATTDGVNLKLGQLSAGINVYVIP
jgi:trimeric autotransporter adhesin